METFSALLCTAESGNTAQMTSREALRLYREKTQDKAPHERVYFFHAHIYYDSDDADETAKMESLMKTLQSTLSKDDHFEIHTLQVIYVMTKLFDSMKRLLLPTCRGQRNRRRYCSAKFPDVVCRHAIRCHRLGGIILVIHSILLLQTKAVGPHPFANSEVLFTRDRFTSFLTYLTFTLPPSFSVLIHPLTKDQVSAVMVDSLKQ